MELPPSLVMFPPMTTLSTPTEVGDVVVMVGKQREVWVESPDWENPKLDANTSSEVNKILQVFIMGNRLLFPNIPHINYKSINPINGPKTRLLEGFSKQIMELPKTTPFDKEGQSGVIRPN